MKVETAFVTDPELEDRYESHGNVAVEEVELDEPKDHEVLIDIEACGVCHSDWHVASGDAPMRHYPAAIGHEAAGTVEQVGDAVTHVEEGDSIVTSYIPCCGKCEPCSQGYQELCVRGQYLEKGPMMDGTFRYHRQETDEDIGQFVLLGVFSEKAVVHKDSVVPVMDHYPAEAACLTGCGVATGFGAAANRADIDAGATTVHFGFGGVGASAVQGAKISGADDIIVVEPKDQRREWAEEMGATRTVDPDEEDVLEVVDDITWGQMADHSFITVDVTSAETIGTALNTVGGRGETVMVAVAPGETDTIDFQGHGAGSVLGMEKELKGTIYGGWSPNYAIPNLLRMYDNGTLPLDDFVSKTYDLDGINDAFDDMLKGNIIRGVVKP